MPRFKVVIRDTTYRELVKEFEAPSADEAEDMAFADDWGTEEWVESGVGGSIGIDRVEPLED